MLQPNTEYTLLYYTILYCMYVYMYSGAYHKQKKNKKEMMEQQHEQQVDNDSQLFTNLLCLHRNNSALYGVASL